MQINKLLTPYNYSDSELSRIKYIVIHYVGALGGAEANCKYYASQYVGASAHYYAGFGGEIWQSVEDKNIAWHCGAKKYVHTECRNANSIGIEMCVRNKGSKADTSRDWYFEDATVQAAIELTKELMAKYNIPADYVIRHYDVTGKVCPNPYVYNHTQHTWDAFKAALTATEVKESGWKEEAGGWRFYNGNTGECVRNAWLEEKEKNLWYWFNAAGIMVTNTWYKYNNAWYYLGPDGVMCRSQLVENSGKIYAVDADGKMVTEQVTLTPDQDGALQYPGLVK
ncbi:peptidoglycan recognition protein family protein [Lacrimispora defluvii]|uniref:N-acetylmuramoyl-L-alanine amidase n=1 Tax=Lacrimispora defluvii TaxID=2719233 RepID=A0ABX1VZJ3_9FIRM|nr:peptidoglycan recognition family protein [Lacrimispora defluvii]NNJ32631.1 N-acetylmuramoyl-L-alanine amidase [Lacrimispora defluvii]